MRLALRSDKPSQLIAAQERVAALVGGELGTALGRRVAALHVVAGEPERAVNALESASDVPSLWLRAAAQDECGATEAAAATLARLGEMETEPARRAEALLRLGELHERPLRFDP